jgi:hypothetical protein
MNEPLIGCPQCEWRPWAEDRWMCVPGCNTPWNTFRTGSVCPGCSHPWQNTRCLACHGISPQRDWYHWPEDLPAVEQRSDLVAAVRGDRAIRV